MRLQTKIFAAIWSLVCLALFNPAISGFAPHGTVIPADDPATRQSDQTTITAGPDRATEDESSISLSWTCSAEGVSGYELEAKLIGPDEHGQVENFSTVHLSPGGQQGSYVCAGLLPGRTYRFRIRPDLQDGGVLPYASVSARAPSLNKASGAASSPATQPLR